jgi:hypothetical protein
MSTDDAPLVLITDENVYETARRPDIVALFTPLLQYGNYAVERLNGGSMHWQAGEKAINKHLDKVANGYRRSRQWWDRHESTLAQCSFVDARERAAGRESDTYTAFLDANGNNNGWQLLRFYRCLYAVCNNRFFDHPDGYLWEYGEDDLEQAQAWLHEYPMRRLTADEIETFEQWRREGAAWVHERDNLVAVFRDLYLAVLGGVPGRQRDALDSAWSVLAEYDEDLPESL